MSTAHGGPDGHHSHGGSGGIGWTLLDTIMTAACIALVCLLVDLLWRSRREGVRYNLTPQGEEAARPRPPAAGEGGPPLVDLDKVREAVDRGDLGKE